MVNMTPQFTQRAGYAAQSVRFFLVALLLIGAGTPVAKAAWNPAGIRLDDVTTNPNFVRIVPDQQGGALVSWTPGPTFSSLLVQRVDANGNVLWTPGGIVVDGHIIPDAGYDLLPDGSGGVFLAWHTSDTYHDQDIYAQHYDAAGNPTLGLDPGGYYYPIVVCNASTPQIGVHLVTDGAAGVIFTWYDSRGGIGPNVWAQRMDAAGNFLWVANGITVAPLNKAQYLDDAIADGAGGVITAWRDERNSATTLTDIYAQRTDASGTPLWGATGVLVANSPDRETGSALVPAGLGQALVVWNTDAAYPNAHQNVQRLNSDGSLGWVVAASITVSQMAAAVDPSDMLSDGAGGLYTAFPMFTATGLDIFGQHIGSSGAVLWGSDGALICGATGVQQHVAVATEAEGGGVRAAWDDNRGGSVQAYQQSLDSLGAPVGPPDGDLVTTLPTIVSYPLAMTEVAPGKQVLAYEDWRNGAFNLFVTEYGGAVSAVPGVRVSDLQLEQASPNPFNPSTEVAFSIAHSQLVAVDIFDLAGSLVKSWPRARYEAGRHTMVWRGQGERGQAVPSGVYVLQVQGEDARLTEKLTLVK